MAKAYTLGIDYGTNSVRALVVDCADGRRSGRSSSTTPRRAGHPARPERPSPRPPEPGRLRRRARGVGERCARRSGEAAGLLPGRRDRIGVDTTGSTPIPVDAKNRPLALEAKWKANLAAQAWLWKDHTGAEEAAAITRTAASTRRSTWRDRRHVLVGVVLVEDLALPEGGAGRLRRGPQLGRARRLRPAVLAGVDDPAKIQRCVCAAGHKAMYSDVWGGLPAKDFLKRLDPRLADLRDRLYEKAHAADGRPALSRRSGRRGWASARESHRDGGLRRALRRGGLGRALGHARQDHRHLHLRLRRGLGEGEGPGRSRHLRDRERLDHARLLRDRGRPVRGGRHPQVVGGGRLRGRREAATPRSPRRRRGSRRASRASWPSTGTTATGRSSSTRC